MFEGILYNWEGIEQQHWYFVTYVILDLLVLEKYVITIVSSLLALRFEPGRFLLKGKMDDINARTQYKNMGGQKFVRCEMNTKEEITKSRVMDWSWDRANIS